MTRETAVRGRSEELFPPGTVLTEADGVVWGYGHEHELPRMLEVFQATFGRWPHFEVDASPLEHLRWKSSPPERSVRPMLFKDAGTIVGTTLEIERHYLVLGKRVVIFDGTDAAVLPTYQARGLFSASRRWMQQNLLPGFAAELYAANPVMAKLLRRTGCLDLGNPIETLATATLGGRLLRRSRGVRVRPVDRFDERVDDLAAAAARSFDVIQVRDRETLVWRYQDPRGGTFRTAIAEDGDELVGYVVTKADGTRGWIADLVAAPGRSDALRALIAASLSQLRADGAKTATTWVPRAHPHRSGLRSAGFLNTRRPPNILYRPMHADPSHVEVLADPHGALHLMPGDFDWI